MDRSDDSPILVAQPMVSVPDSIVNPVHYRNQSDQIRETKPCVGAFHFECFPHPSATSRVFIRHSSVRSQPLIEFFCRCGLGHGRRNSFIDQSDWYVSFFVLILHYNKFAVAHVRQQLTIPFVISNLSAIILFECCLRRSITAQRCVSNHQFTF